MREDDLIAAALADRDDPAPYRVFGDYLEQRGDPQGQLVALQLHNAETNLSDAATLSKEKTHFIRYPALLPELDRWRAHVFWKWGFIDRVELEDPSPDDLRLLLDHKSCVLLRRLQIDLAPEAVGSVLAALSQRISTIEEIALRVPIDEPAAPAAPDLWERVPRLRVLAIEGQGVFEVVRHPRLQSLSFEGVPFSSSAVWELPALEKLHWLEPGSVQGMAPLWNSELPALRTLSVGGSVDADYIDEHFFKAIRRLTALAMPIDAFGGEPIEALEALLEHTQHFTHLESFDVEWMFGFEEDDDEDTASQIAELRAELRAALPKLVEGAHRV